MRPINLLPPEVGQERSRRRRIGAGVFAACVYAALLVVGVIYWSGKVAAARSDVDAQSVINQSLEGDVVALSSANVVKTEYDGKADLVRAALSSDVDWGIFLNDLARLLPTRVWMETFSGTIGSTSIPGVLGQVAFSGVGFDYPDVSEWLRALDSGQFSGVTGPWVSTVSQGAIGDSDVVTFSSTAVLTGGAATNRADTLIPEVP